MCHRCRGASKDYRTAARHAKLDESERPLFPPSLESSSESKSESMDLQEEEVRDNAMPVEDKKEDPPDHDPLDAIVSQAEMVENINEPVFHTVNCARLYVHALYEN